MALHGVLHSEIQVFLSLSMCMHASVYVENRMHIYIYICKNKYVQIFLPEVKVRALKAIKDPYKKEILDSTR
jgi:hypothetical protein